MLDNGVSMANKKVIIIGGGVSGLASGIYLRINGYQTMIIEKNHVVGGACIGWERKGSYVDGCIHWLTGVNKNSSFYKFWRETGAINDDTEIFYQDDFHVIEFPDGKKFTVWADLDKFQNELIAFAPEDSKQINKFIKTIRRFQKIEGPVFKPVDMMNLFELIKIGLTMAGDYYHVAKTSVISCEDYGKKFKNPYIRKWFKDVMSAEYNFMSLIYMLAHVSNKNGGIPVGGSQELSERMKEKYISLGGELLLSKEVSCVEIENNVAKGVNLINGEFIPSDYVVSSAPIEHTLKILLKGKYKVPKIDKRLEDIKTYPIYTYTTVVLKLNCDCSNLPLSNKIYLTNPITLDVDYDNVTFRNYAYDKTLKGSENSTVIQATLSGNDDCYFWWKKIKKNGLYKEKKQELASKIIEIYENYKPELKTKIEVIDVVTPLTYERYLNTRHGSFQGFVHTAKGKALMQKGEIKGLNNFILSGQGIFQSGGLPTAVITGRFSAQRIIKKDKGKFKSL